MSSASFGLLFSWRNITWQRVEFGMEGEGFDAIICARHRNLITMGFICIPLGLVAQFLFKMLD